MKKKEINNPNIKVIERLKHIDVSNCGISLHLASSMSKDVNPEYQRVQFTKSIENEFATIGIDKVNEVMSNISDGSTELKIYQAGTKLDSHQIEYIYLTEYPEFESQIEPLAKNQNVFTGNEEFISGIRFYVITLTKPNHQPIHLLRLYSPKKELSRSRLVGAIFVNGQFDKIEEKTFLFDKFVDCIIYGDILLILSKDRVQKIFRYYELLTSEAKKTLSIIKKTIPIENFDEFENDCLNHVHKLAKLHNISQKPYLNSLTMKDMKKVISKVSLNVTTTKKGGKEMLVYDKSNHWEILRLLDDDYLESIMTGTDYEVNSKRQIIID